MELMIQGFEWYLPYDGKHWTQLLNKIDAWSDLGVSAIWLPPAYKGHKGINDSGYGVYDMYDLGEFDQKGSIKTKYGSKDEFIKLVEYIESKGIKVYHDIVLNHRLGGDEMESVKAYEVDPMNRNNIGNLVDIKAWSLFDFKGRNNVYSSFKWNHHHFKGMDIYHKLYLFENKKWDQDVSLEFNNYDYLMGLDVDFNNEDVKNEIKAWSKWYFNITKGRAVRLDAIKHIQSRFFNWWLDYIKEFGVEDVVGEYWGGYDKELMAYLDIVRHKMKLFDVPLHYNLYDASKYETYDLRYIFDSTLVGQVPEDTITFVDNHDTQIGQSLESWVEDWFKPMAYALILLRDTSTPCVFYKDIEEKSYVQELLKIRKEYVTGTRVDYFNHPHRIAWTQGDLLVVMSNHEGGILELEIEGNYTSIWDIEETIESLDGSLKIEIPAKSLRIYRRV